MEKQKDNSKENINITIAKIIIIFLSVISLCLLALGPKIVEYFLQYKYSLIQDLYARKILLYILGYSCGIIALLFFSNTFFLINNIGKNDIFIDKNIILIKKISNEITAALLISFIIGCLCFTPFLIVSAVMLFTISIVKIIVAIFEKAVSMNDFLNYTV